MKTTKIILATLLTVAVSSTHAAETLIDFEADEFKQAHSALNTFTYENITFSGIGRESTLGNFAFKNQSIRETPDFSGYFLETGATNFETLKFSFATAVSDFSFNLGNNNNNWRLDAFDESGTKIDSLMIDKLSSSFANNDGAFFGLSSGSANISYATLTDLEEGAFGGLIEDAISIDNFKYTNTSPIPEPSTYALMLGGLGLIGFMAARRRKQLAPLN